MNPDLKEIGIGTVQGNFTSGRGTFDGVMVIQNFGRTHRGLLGFDTVLPDKTAVWSAFFSNDLSFC